MSDSDFVDYYEVLEISPNATYETIVKMFRAVARRYHPDNTETGDRIRFDAALQAMDILKDSEKRAQYDVRYRYYLESQSQHVREERDCEDIGRDMEIQNKILSMLYIKRRANIRNPGIGNAELARRTDCSYDHLDFHLWYLKEKGWIKKGDDGLFAITIDGVDRATDVAQEIMGKKLITDQS